MHIFFFFFFCLLASIHFLLIVGTIDDIAPDIRGIVYADAMQLGGETEWNWMLNRYRTSTQIVRENNSSLFLLKEEKKNLVREASRSPVVGCIKQHHSLASNISDFTRRINRPLARRLFTSRWSEVRGCFVIVLSSG